MAEGLKPLLERVAALTADDLARGLEVFGQRLKAEDAAGMQACVHCGLCAESCHAFKADPIFENMPAAKLDALLAVFKQQATTSGRWLGSWVGARPFTPRLVSTWIDAVYGRCTLCGRCSLNCTVGITLPSIFRAARAALSVMGLAPSGLRATLDLASETGNTMGVPEEDWRETIAWMEEELQLETGDATARIPVDEPGARVLLLVNPREPKFYPLQLLASAKVFWAAKERWTLCSEGWDLTNYGLFTGELEAGTRFAERTAAMARRLGVSIVALGECGHGYAAHRWEGPEWRRADDTFRFMSVLELLENYLSEGRITVDPSRHKGRITLHDPCNLVRHGGVSEPQRAILRRLSSNFVEMTPNRAENYCCGGGGGALTMGEYRERRLASGRVKADQVKATGATLLAVPCHNCADQLEELNKEHQLGVHITNVTELVAEALVL